MSQALWIAIAGIAGTAAAPWGQSLLSARHERKSWRRDQRAAVYADALAYAQRIESMLEGMVDPMTTPSRPRLEVAHSDLITARMRLVATADAFEAWKAMREGEDIFRWMISENYPGLGQDDPFEGLPNEDEDLVMLRQRLTKFYEATRRGFDT
jgi:hypothetical protein